MRDEFGKHYPADFKSMTTLDVSWDALVYKDAWLAIARLVLADREELMAELNDLKWEKGENPNFSRRLKAVEEAAANVQQEMDRLFCAVLGMKLIQSDKVRKAIDAIVAAARGKHE